MPSKRRKRKAPTSPKTKSHKGTLPIFWTPAAEVVDPALLGEGAGLGEGRRGDDSPKAMPPASTAASFPEESAMTLRKPENGPEIGSST